MRLRTPNLTILSLLFTVLVSGCGTGIAALDALVPDRLPAAQTGRRAPNDEPPIVNTGNGFALQVPPDWGPLPVEQRPIITYQGISD